MNLKTFLQGPWFQRSVLLVWLVSSALVMFSQKTIDSIVNVTLYGYGLQFSNKWAIPYWTYARLLYATQFVCIALSAVALTSGFLKKDNSDKHVPKPEERIDKKAAAREETKGRTIVISCSSCKRVVSKPLVMLDFSGGKAKLVNVCPYCNTVLGKAEKQNDTETIVDPGKEVVQ
ncbi:MAG: hypothetical protein WCD81_11805 [Candidatus Bathyarchaeia archaeon]